MKNVKINGQIRRKHKKPSVLIIFGTGLKDFSLNLNLITEQLT